MKPQPYTTLVITDDNGWTYTRDTFGDWRGERKRARTRLKCSLEAAHTDVQSGRLQRKHGDTWDDQIDQFNRRKKAA